KCIKNNISEQTEERMQTEAFLVFIDQFTTYLRDFIIELKQTTLKIQKLLKAIYVSTLHPFLKQVITHQQHVPRFEDIQLDEEELIQTELDKWQSLSIWFLGNELRESELDMLQIRTNEQRSEERRVGKECRAKWEPN